ncbi:hypothetical protein [Desulfocurvus sp. DL9XJH121]
MKQALFRGVMIGGALGIMATYVLGWNPPRAFALGVAAGFFAGLTRYLIDRRKRGER